jgi:hypothetical protein
MAPRDDGSSSRELRQLEARHQLDRRAPMPPRNRRQRRQQSHQVAQRAREDDEHARIGLLECHLNFKAHSFRVMNSRAPQ